MSGYVKARNLKVGELYSRSFMETPASAFLWYSQGAKDSRAVKCTSEAWSGRIGTQNIRSDQVALFLQSPPLLIMWSRKLVLVFHKLYIVKTMLSRKHQRGKRKSPDTKGFTWLVMIVMTTASTMVARCVLWSCCIWFLTSPKYRFLCFACGSTLSNSFTYGAFKTNVLGHRFDRCSFICSSATHMLVSAVEMQLLLRLISGVAVLSYRAVNQAASTWQRASCNVNSYCTTSAGKIKLVIFDLAQFLKNHLVCTVLYEVVSKGSKTQEYRTNVEKRERLYN